MQRVARAIIAVSFVLVVAVGSYAGGLYVERTRGLILPSPAVASSQDAKLPALVREVQDDIRTQALRPPSETSMTIDTLDGLLKSMDDTYAVYFDPSSFKDFQMNSTGEFFGVGMTLGMKDATPTIITVFKGSPAAKAGLRPGDTILAIDGAHNPNRTLDDVVNRIRGPRGTIVRIRIARKGVPAPITYTVRRDKIAIPNTTSELLNGKVGYIRLFEFNSKAASDVSKATKDLARRGAKGYILDLRENPGGQVAAAVGLVSLYVKSGVVVRMDARGRPEESDQVVGGVITNAPVVVLVDGQSASSAEIAAGALQDHKRATIVGEKTYGKGSVQTVVDLSNGGAVKFTTAHYLTPNRHVVDGAGIRPDVVVKMDPHLQAKHATDTQLKKALQILQKQF